VKGGQLDIKNANTMTILKWIVEKLFMKTSTMLNYIEPRTDLLEGFAYQ
jgi:hypothetical protein